MDLRLLEMHALVGKRWAILTDDRSRLFDDLRIAVKQAICVCGWARSDLHGVSTFVALSQRDDVREVVRPSTEAQLVSLAPSTVSGWLPLYLSPIEIVFGHVPHRLPRCLQSLILLTQLQ